MSSNGNANEANDDFLDGFLDESDNEAEKEAMP
jgi:hypothetical protein